MPLLKDVLIGIVAGLIATLALSVLMLTKEYLPQLDTITMLDGVLGAFLAELRRWAPPAPIGGWLWFFAIGTVWWGALYAVMEPILPGRWPWARGLSFGAIATLLVWLMVLPLAGAGYFGMRLSAIQPVVTLFEHLVYGVILGEAYGRLNARTRSPDSHSSHLLIAVGDEREV